MKIKLKESLEINDKVRNFISKAISDYTNGTGTVNLYHDYDDYFNPSTVKKAFEYAQDHNSSIRDYLIEIFNENNYDYFSEYDLELVKAVKNAANELGDEEIINFIEDADDYGDIYDVLYECGYNGVDYDIDDYVNTCYVNLILATPEEANYDMSSITSCYLTDRMEDPDTFNEYKDNALTYLIKSVGSTPEEVNDILFGRATTSDKTIKSIIRELENCYEGQLVNLTICAKINDLDMLNRLAKGSGSFTAKRDCMIGLYDAWNGGGSTMDIDVNSFTFPGSLIFDVEFDGKGARNTVGDIYRLSSSAWGTLV